jgi:2,4-dienoyl-CoA reductase-like NADH-dependent reductase (Old Yellow Enzyme family)
MIDDSRLRKNTIDTTGAGLFEPITIDGMTLRNRIVKAALHENTARPDGLPTSSTRELYERWAYGGAGLLITGEAYVNRAGQVLPRQHGAHADAVIPAWRAITAIVHRAGARIAMQLNHGGRQIKPRPLNGHRPLAPSPAPNLLYFTWARAMSDQEIWQTIHDFGAAASRAKAAGFDAVELHAAHGFLISSFLSPLTNRRNDDWGGDPERRFRFLAEVYRAVRAAVGDGFPVLCKLNVDDFVGLGLKPKESFAAARRLGEMGLSGLEISGGVVETITYAIRGGFPDDILARGRSPLTRLYLEAAGSLRPRFEEAYFAPYTEALKATLDLPLILVGGIRTPGVAEEIVASGMADLIAMGRPLIREPRLPNMWAVGNRQTASCRSCNRCLAEMDQGNTLQCYCSSGRRAVPGNAAQHNHCVSPVG